MFRKLRSLFKGKSQKTDAKKPAEPSSHKEPSHGPGTIDPKTCPHAEGYVTAEGGLAQNFVCARCGALVNNTPFGKELLLEDARDRFPELATQFDVERWKDPIYALLRNDAHGKSKAPANDLRSS